MRMADDIGLIHFIGIGGIGMSAIAEVLHKRKQFSNESAVQLGGKTVFLILDQLLPDPIDQLTRGLPGEGGGPDGLGLHP